VTSQLFASWLGVTWTIETTEAFADRLASDLADILTWTPPPEDPMLHLELDEFGRPPDTNMSGPPVQNALAELTRFAIDHSPMLGIHAGTIASPRGVIAFPGVSGLGKTTLIAALVQRGFGYLSDEVLAIDRRTLAVGAFPRPLALDAASWALLGLDPADAPCADAEQLIRPGILGTIGVAAEVSDIVLPVRGSFPTSLEPASRGLAVGELLGRAFNHYVDGAASFHAVVAIARGANVWRLEYSDAPDAANLLHARWLTA
jgi:hypothetical protein